MSKTIIEEPKGDAGMRERMRTSLFFIESSGLEKSTLWLRHNESAKWEEDLNGFSQVVGYLDEKRTKLVNVSFSFAKVHGHRVCFFDPCSRFVDHAMIKEFLDTHYPEMKDAKKPQRIRFAGWFDEALQYCKNLK